MHLKEIYSSEYRKKKQSKIVFEGEIKPIISFEVFPPKTDDSKLFEELNKLLKYNPELISVTYGAGGSNKDGSLNLVKKIKNLKTVTPMPHFTCMCSSKEFLNNYIDELKALEIENVLALRGDKPKDIEICHSCFKYANELVDFIKSKTAMSVAVAGYPEVHNEAQDIKTDITNLKKKIDAGAEAIFTQLFFNNDHFYRYKQLVRHNDIYTPIIPGILPITSYAQLEKMTSMCKVEIPRYLTQQLEKYKDDIQATTEIGIDFAIYQCQQLLDAGVEGLHFYILNKAYSTSEILDAIF